MKQSIRKITLAAALIVCGCTMADATGLVRVSTKTGNSVTIQLTENPKVTPTANGVSVTYTGSELQFSYDSEPTFEFVTGSSVEKMSLDGLAISQQGGVIHVKGLTPGEALDLYNIEGMPVCKSHADAAGAASVSINECANGIYIIKTNKLTTKLIKR